MLCGIFFYDKSFHCKSTLRIFEKLKGRKLRAPPKLEKSIFFIYEGARNILPFNFFIILKVLLEGKLFE